MLSVLEGGILVERNSQANSSSNQPPSNLRPTPPRLFTCHWIIGWIILGVMLGKVAKSATAEDWYRFRGPNLDGISSETEWTHQWPPGGPNVLWRANVGTGFSSTPTSQGRLYTIGNEENVDTVYCINVETGEQIWAHSYASPTEPNEFEGGPTSTPTIDGDTVVTLSRSGDLFSFEKDTGKVNWSLNVPEAANVRVPAWGFAGSPLAHGDRLILNVGDAGVAVDRRSGQLAWASEDKESGYSSPIPYSIGSTEGVILGSARSYVAVDPKSGSELWRQRWLTTFGCNAADPIISGNQVFLSSGYNRGSGLLDISGGEPEVIWKHKEFQNQLSTSVLIDGYLYGASGDVDAGAELVCVKLESGELQWVADSVRVGGISAAGDRLILLSDSGELVIATASPEKFDILARHEVLDGKCWTAPVLSENRIYCRSARGEVACVDVQPR